MTCYHNLIYDKVYLLCTSLLKTSELGPPATYSNNSVINSTYSHHRMQQLRPSEDSWSQPSLFDIHVMLSHNHPSLHLHSWTLVELLPWRDLVANHTVHHLATSHIVNCISIIYLHTLLALFKKLLWVRCWSSAKWTKTNTPISYSNCMNTSAANQWKKDHLMYTYLLLIVI